MEITAKAEIRSKWLYKSLKITFVNFFLMNPTVVVAKPVTGDHTNSNAPLFVEAVPVAPGNVQHQEVYHTPTPSQAPSVGYGYPVNPAYQPGVAPAYPQPIGIVMPQNQHLE